MPHSAGCGCFVSLAGIMERFYMLTKLPEEGCTEFVKFQCTCPSFWDNRVCKHSLALGMIQGLFVVPADKDSTVIGQKGKRGRPPAVTPKY